MCGFSSYLGRFVNALSTHSPEKVRQKPKERESKDESHISSGVVRVQVNQSTCTEGSLLPTLSGLFENKTYVRVLKDSGCQTNIISSKLANDFNLKIVKQDVKLSISGFNEVKDYITNVVEFDLSLGDKTYVIDAICVPNIGIELAIPGLGGLVSEFQTLGYKLADRFLNTSSDAVSNVEIILGTDSSHCFEETSCLYGNPVPSVYYKSPFGVMLVGNVSRALANVQFLKPCYSATKSDVKPKPKPKKNKFSTQLTTKTPEKCVFGADSTVSSVSLFSSSVETNLPLIASKVTVIDHKGQPIESALDKATREVLCQNYMDTNYDPPSEESSLPELDEDLIKFALSNAEREEDGRLKLPLLWNGQVSHLLGSNRGLAEKVLKSNFHKLKKSPDQLKLVDDSIKEWEDMGIIERIPDLDAYLDDHPNHSFLAHMGVFKLERETSKCRVVFFSNLCERNKAGLCSLSIVYIIRIVS